MNDRHYRSSNQDEAIVYRPTRLSCTTDESVDIQSLHPDLMIGNVDRSSDVNLSGTGNQDGKTWQAVYTVKDGDNGAFQWNFHGIDRSIP